MNYLLVFIQFAGILFFIFTGPSIPASVPVFVLQAIAFVLGVWAIVAMKLHTLTVLPSVKQGGKLCSSGPYRILRHPMYTAVLLFLLALLINQYSMSRAVVFAVVFVDLMFKMQVEEKILLFHYPNYKKYMQGTYRLIPFVY